MLRIVVVALAACSQIESPATPSSELFVWLDVWEHVRSCVIAREGDTLADGAAVAMLRAECREPVADLVRLLPFDESATAYWQRVAAQLNDRSSRVRAEAVASADDVIAMRRLQLDLPELLHERIPLPVLRAGEALVIDGLRIQPGGSISFAGGRIRGSQKPNSSFVATSPTVGHAWIALDPFAATGLPSGTWKAWLRDVEPSRPVIAAADHGSKRIVVRETDRAAYSLAVSEDDGRTWSTTYAEPGTYLVGSYQDPISGDIELLVHEDLFNTRHRIAASTGKPRIDVWYYAGQPTNIAVAAPEVCRHDDSVWRLADHDIGQLSSGAIRLWPLGGSTVDAKVDCRGDFALVLRRDRSRDVVEKCGVGCLEVFRSTSDPRGAAALLADGTWLYAASKESVVMLRREGRRPIWYRMPANGEVVAIVVLARLAYLVVDERTHYRLVPLP